MRIQSGEGMPRLRLLIFSAPVCALQAMELPWRLFLPAFLTAHVGLSLGSVAGLLMWIRFFDVVADPVVGWLSDHIPTPMGRRRFWMLASVPSILVGAGSMFFATPGTGIASIALAGIALHLGFTLLVIPHGGWAMELGRTPKQSTRIMAARMWCLAAATPIVVMIPICLDEGGPGRPIQLAAFGALVMALTIVTVLPLLATYREPTRPGPPSAKTVTLISTARELLGEPPIAMALGLYGLLGLSDASSAATLLFFLDQGMGLGRQAGMLILVPSLAALITMPIWSSASNRLGKPRALALAYGWNAATAGAALILPEGRWLPLAAYLVLRGLSWGADYVLLRAIIADCVNGGMRAGTAERGASAYALCNVTLKISAALGVGGALFLLALLGFVPGEAASPLGKLALRWMIAVPPVTTSLLALALLRFGPAFGRAGVPALP